MIALLFQSTPTGGSTTGIVGYLTIFVLAAFVGIEVVSKVPSILHTPLMSGSNAIHGIVLVGALTIMGEAHGTAEVTLGGVDTRALNSRTMMAEAVAGLYFIGEVVDVTGWLGGYNFQWAWASGWSAGQAV